MTPYQLAKADHFYLWNYAPARDMTGGYVDQNDLYRMLAYPSKSTATLCFHDQIAYWFQIGPERDADDGWRTDPQVRRIARRHGHEQELDDLLEAEG